MVDSFKFSGHESFPCKSLWLKKGYDFVKSGKDFNSPNAVIELGVGKNMVASIRFWLKAFGICDESGHTTEIGDFIFDEQTGRDKYIEDLATLWLLHFNLVNTAEASIYYLFFVGFQREHSVFSKKSVVDFVKNTMTEQGRQKSFNENTVSKDVNVLFQNYVLPRKFQSNEDFSSLLIDLDFIRTSYEGKDFFVNREGKRSVPMAIFLYTLLVIKGNDNTISYETIKEKIGCVFCMSDGEIINMLKQINQLFPQNISYSDNSGIRQIQIINEMDPLTILNEYYERI